MSLNGKCLTIPLSVPVRLSFPSAGRFPSNSKWVFLTAATCSSSAWNSSMCCPCSSEWWNTWCSPSREGTSDRCLRPLCQSVPSRCCSSQGVSRTASAPSSSPKASRHPLWSGSDRVSVPSSSTKCLKSPHPQSSRCQLQVLWCKGRLKVCR